MLMKASTQHVPLDFLSVLPKKSWDGIIEGAVIASVKNSPFYTDQVRCKALHTVKQAAQKL